MSVTFSVEAFYMVSASLGDGFMAAARSLENKSLFDRLLDIFSSITTIITGIAMVVMTAIFGWLVFGRYVLNETPTWVEQYSLLLIVCIGFLGASVGVHQKTHLGVSVFREMSPKPVRRVFDFLTHCILAGFGILMAVYGYRLTVFKWSVQIPLIRISEGWRSFPIILSGALIFLYSIGHLVHFFLPVDKKKMRNKSGDR
jgi:TRAP-type C4-dicarboxylate transport system permease small subunit